MRTGNVLLEVKHIDREKEPFNPRFGRSGGEDVDFFRRMMKKGHVFIWCDEACVYETVPPERLTKAYHLYKAFLRGTTNASRAPLLSLDTLKSSVAILFYTVGLPFLFLLGQHWFMKYLISDCDHLAKVIGRLGISLVKERRYE